MRKRIYLSLALTNIKKNRGTYIPYMITCVGCITILYVMLFVMANPGLTLMRGGDVVKTIMPLGIGVLAIFSCIFLMYSNSFLMKRRQKELGLYNILGMEKGHISKMLLAETILTSIVSLAVGLLSGIFLSKLALLILLRLIKYPVQFGFFVSLTGIGICCAAYGAIFLLILLNNLRRVHLSRPIELLQGSSVGEREPKAKWLQALLGFVCLGSGYYLAVTTENPLNALGLFFVAVLLVMAGTYLLFVAGSIAVLKIMRWKKKFYYKTKNFTSISGMLYRMKQNAVGLASICILSTGVLLMLSSTISLYFGVGDVVKMQYPHEIGANFRGITLEEGKEAAGFMKETVKSLGLPAEDLVSTVAMNVTCIAEGNEIRFPGQGAMMTTSPSYLTLFPLEDYEESQGTELSLSPGETAVFRASGIRSDSLKIAGSEYQVVQWLDEWPLQEDPDPYGMLDELIALVVTDEDFARIDAAQKEAYGKNASSLYASIGMDVAGTEEDELAWGHRLEEEVDRFVQSGAISEEAYVKTWIRKEHYADTYPIYGGLLFLGILLGLLFLMGTTMIIYYKQTSEGYEDKSRFEIMRKVGMSKKEVKSSIHRQILMVFFLPLLMAILHIAMAFPMVRRLLMLLYMMNTRLYILCTAGTILAFALVYALIYMITARSYYRILEKAE